MPTSAPGSDAAAARRGRVGRPPRGFTLVELLVVVALIGLAAAVVGLALRDRAQSQLEVEGARLVALLESARAEARAGGLEVRWVPGPDVEQTSDFRFVGLPPSQHLPRRWLERGVDAQVVGSTSVALGPDAILPPQRIVLRLDDARLALASDGLSPFAVDPAAPAP